MSPDTLTGVPQLGLRSALTWLLRQPGEEVLHLPRSQRLTAQMIHGTSPSKLGNLAAEYQR